MIWRYAFFGSSDFGLPTVEALQTDPRFQLAQVVTQPPRPSGRGHKLTPTPVSDWAHQQGLPCSEWASLRNQPSIPTAIKSWMCDFMLVAAYGCIVPAELLNISRGWLNLHASILPRHRGASPIAGAIASGDQQTGVSMMLMEAGIDTGPVLKTIPVPIQPNDTTPALEHKLATTVAPMVADTLAGWLGGTLSAKPQDESQASYAPKLTKDHGHCTWDSAVSWERKVRAYTPWPGVWSRWNGQRIAWQAAEVEAGKPTEPPGTVVQLSGDRWGVACSDGWFIPKQIQRAGRQAIPAANAGRDWTGLIGSRLT